MLVAGLTGVAPEPEFSGIALEPEFGGVALVVPAIEITVSLIPSEVITDRSRVLASLTLVFASLGFVGSRFRQSSCSSALVASGPGIRQPWFRWLPFSAILGFVSPVLVGSHVR